MIMAVRKKSQSEKITSRRVSLIGASLIFAVWVVAGCGANPTQPIAETMRQGEKFPDPGLYFRITVVDEGTSRGIPLVKLTTLTNVVHYTDSAGVVAFYEPGLMNREVYFEIESDGYSIEPDAFGMHGRVLNVRSGGGAVIAMKRLNIAQRLYRITGAGIYRDSVLLGDKVPIRHPLINASVAGQDSALTATYRGQLFWVWGDTGNPKHPIAGNFKVTCATSKLPSDGGLDPDVGVELNYFTEGDFVKQMAPLPGQYLYWLSSLLTVKDSTGQERFLANYARIKPPMEAVGRGMVQFNDEKQVFEEIAQDSLDNIIQPDGHPFRVSERGVEYYYFPYATRFTRVKADYDSIRNRAAYEAFTCLKEGRRFNCTAEQLDRAEDGSLRYSWKKNTSPIGQEEQDKLIKAGLIKPNERWFNFIDVESGKEVLNHACSIYWNEYRHRWTMVACQAWGTSMLGEIWYAEADTPLGPWAYAQKVVTHKNYSFYNPVQHPQFAKDNGRVIYFEGTYTKTFSGNENATPRYEYNQIMYKLELDDPRLCLPVPIYRIENGGTQYLPGDKISDAAVGREVTFYALDRPRKTTIPIYAVRDESANTTILTAVLPPSALGAKATPAFYALPGETKSPPPATVSLYEFVHAQTGAPVYKTEPSIPDASYRKTEQPVCLVW
jgi:hypothetical protein